MISENSTNKLLPQLFIVSERVFRYTELTKFSEIGCKTMENNPRNFNSMKVSFSETNYYDYILECFSKISNIQGLHLDDYRSVTNIWLEECLLITSSVQLFCSDLGILC